MSRSPFTVLSKREQEVLVVVARDKTDREIARLLGIRERTVRAHVSRIILKLGVASRVGAAVAFVEWSMRAGICQCADCDVAEQPMATPRAELPR
jgi:DNA-binding NarL/FixJ family response regulator